MSLLSNPIGQLSQLNPKNFINPKTHKPIAYNAYDPRFSSFVDFESIFVKMMLSSVEKAQNQNFPQNSLQTSFIQDSFYQKISVDIARSSPLDIGKTLYQEQMNKNLIQ